MSNQSPSPSSLEGEALEAGELNEMLTTTRATRSKKDPTEPRTIETWFALNHEIKEDGCDNPNCTDPRPKATDLGTNIVADIRGKGKICRYCYLEGYLSTSNKND